MKFSELVQKLGATEQTSLCQDAAHDPDITGVASIAQATPRTLSYVEGRKFLADLKQTKASAVILVADEQLQACAAERGLAWLVTREPRLLFAQAIALFYQPFRPAAGIHPTAVIDPTTQIGAGVAIGAHAVVHAGVILGDQVCIHPNVVVYPGAQIGDRTILYANCVIHERSQLGADCVIHSGAVIGSEGFGFVPTADGWFKMEQSGYVVLEDGVEIGCNSTVDRPAVGETRIGRNTKIDNLVQIGHECQIGSGCAMASQVGLAGGVEVGDRVILAGQVGIANRITIGSGTTATARAGIISDVEPRSLISGHPAVPHRQWLKNATFHARLPDLHRTLKQLQAEMAELQQQIKSLQADAELRGEE
jgi:UDP-3-O-[3-hydroxymyristoyl] glucosamine N-acyltransferase